MKKKMTLTAFAMAAGTILLFSACKNDKLEEAPPPPPPPPRTSSEFPPPPPGMPPGDPSITPPPVRTVLDEEVKSRWKGVEITVTEKEEGGQAYKVEIPLGGEADVEGTPFKVKLMGFVPDFSMGADSITTKSLDDVNPAAKIQVLEGEEVLFTGWSFRDFPGMHSFDDPRYNLVLTRALPAE